MEKKIKILCILSDGFEDIEAVGSIALLRRSQIEVDVASLKGNSAVGKYNNKLVDLKNIGDLDREAYDCLLLPGGPHFQELKDSPPVRDLIRYFHKSDKYLAAICASPTILGEMGYLEGKNYTCFTSMDADFGGTYTDEYAVIDGKIITGRSAAAVIDFAFMIIRALQGSDQEQAIKNEIYY